MATKPAGEGTGAERRRHPRKNIIEDRLLTVDVSLGHEESQSGWQRGIVIDLSEGGMAVQPFLPLKPGTVGQVCLELPGKNIPISSSGIVAWVGQSGRAGIRFIDVPEGVREHLREWLNLRPQVDAPSATAASESVAPALNASLDTDELDFHAALQLIAERAQLISGAGGAAIALGDRHGMVCRASSGLAPDIGAELRADSGLSGYCLRTGEIVYCADIQTHPSVDANAARHLDLGSIIIVPISVAGQLAGLLEVLSPRPNAFDDRLVTRLEHFAALLSAAIEEHQSNPNAGETTSSALDVGVALEPKPEPQPAGPPSQMSPLAGPGAMPSGSSDPESENAKLKCATALSSLPQAPLATATTATAGAPTPVEPEKAGAPVIETASAEPAASAATDAASNTAVPVVIPAMGTSEAGAFGSSLSTHAHPSPAASRTRQIDTFIFIVIGTFLILAAAVAAGWFARERYGTLPAAPAAASRQILPESPAPVSQPNTSKTTPARRSLR